MPPLAHGDGGCECSGDVSTLKPGDAVTIFARFAVAPSAGSFAVEVPGFPPFDGVRAGD